MRLFGDRPISRPEDDALGLSSFASALATSLLQMSPKEGLVISVEGPWGSGKSSGIALTLRTIKLRVLSKLGEKLEALEKLNEDDLDAKWDEKAKSRKTHLVRFNPWNFSGQENLVRAFFRELAAQIDAEPDGALKKAANRVAGYLPSIGGLLAAGSVLASGSLPAAAAAGAAGRAAGEAAERALKSETTLESARKTLSAALREAGVRIIVVIDDLDRLMPSEMRAVLAIVKSLGDLPNILYVLAFDESVVRNALENSSEKIDPDFLEKIVQVSLKLPPPWRLELRQLFFSRLNAIVGDVHLADQERWHRMFLGGIDPYLETPRDVTRLINSIQVIWPNVAGDVDFTDLIAITTLQLFDAQVYELIRDEIERVTGADYRYEDDKTFGDRMEPKFAKKPIVAKEVMTLLFPRLARAWNAPMQDGSYYVTQQDQRRICTKEYHRNYFIFGRDPRRLTRAEIDQIVTAQDPSAALASTLKRMADDQPEKHPSRVPALLEQMSSAIYAQPLLTPELLRAILDHSSYLIEREDEVWELFSTDNGLRLSRLIRAGIESLDIEARTEILTVLVSYESGLATRADCIEDEVRRHGLFGGERRHETEWLFSTDEITAAAEAIRDQIATFCESGAVWQAPKPIDLIWAWKRLGGDGRLAEWMKRVLTDDELVVRVAKEAPGKSHRTGGGKGPRIVLTFNRRSWQELLDVDELYDRLEALSPKRTDAASALERLREAEKASMR
jgi:predicted KAP-like P-loop ATPase